MGLLLLTGFALLHVGSRARGQRSRLPSVWIVAASLVLVLLVLGHLPRGF